MKYKLIIDGKVCEPLFRSEKRAKNYFCTFTTGHLVKTCEIVPIVYTDRSIEENITIYRMTRPGLSETEQQVERIIKTRLNALEQLELYNKKNMDLYHAIENADSNIELLRIAKLFQAELRERRKQKSKIDPRNNTESVKKYKNRTQVLKKLPPPKRYDEIVDAILECVM